MWLNRYQHIEILILTIVTRDILILVFHYKPLCLLTRNFFGNPKDFSKGLWQQRYHAIVDGTSTISYQLWQKGLVRDFILFKKFNYDELISKWPHCWKKVIRIKKTSYKFLLQRNCCDAQSPELSTTVHPFIWVSDKFTQLPIIELYPNRADAAQIFITFNYYACVNDCVCLQDHVWLCYGCLRVHASRFVWCEYWYLFERVSWQRVHQPHVDKTVKDTTVIKSDVRFILYP